MEKKPELSIIISTYNAVDWLKKTLWGYAFQTFKDFEIIIADDGSDAQTKAAERAQEEMTKLTDGLGLPKDMKLPF